MIPSGRNKPSDGRQGNDHIPDFAQSPPPGHQAEVNAHRGHLPPPFYSARDENFFRRQYPSEGRLPDHLREDVANYGRGGYYGYTYQQDTLQPQRVPSPGQGRGDSYRHLGDRRWLDEGHSWEAERAFRSGYRPLRERTAASATHEGKGPRSYRRPDQRILEDISDRLYDDPYVNATDVEVQVNEGDVILSGTVESRQAKRRVEDIAESVSGARNVENRLRVMRPDTAG